MYHWENIMHDCVTSIILDTTDQKSESDEVWTVIRASTCISGTFDLGYGSFSAFPGFQTELFTRCCYYNGLFSSTVKDENRNS